MEIKKLYRITLKNNRTNEIRTTTTWFKDMEEIETTVRRLMPFTSIENVIEITSESLKIKTI